MSTDFIQQFHFLDPWWLLGLILAALFIWLLWQQRGTSGLAWKKVVESSLLPYLLVKNGESSKIHLPVILLALGWVLSMLALANPVWQRLPQPVYQQPEAQVIVLDLAPSMLAQDISPSRMVQARYKVEDILRLSKGKQTGLVVYSGDAFTVTPLTDDIATLKSQLRVLEPSLMPAMGNRPDLGLNQAGELLKQAGFRRGHIILLADESGNNNTVATSKKLTKDGYQVSVLGIGTATGAPIPGVRDTTNKPIMSRVDNKALQQIANAGNGQFAAFTSNQQDVERILADSNSTASSRAVKNDAEKKQADRWKQMGPYLSVLLLPLLAFAFRRGWLLSIALVIMVQFSMPQPAMASGWNNLWQRPDQQAAQALQSGKFAEAARIAPDVSQRGAAEYKEGNYQKAIESFSQQNDITGAYNLGNALAKSGDYKEALAAYDKVLKQQPNMENAAFNRKLVEELLKKQQEQQSKQDKQQSAQGSQQEKKQGQGQQQQGKQEDQSGQQAKQKSGQHVSDQQEPDKQASDKHQDNQNQGESGKQNQQKAYQQGKQPEKDQVNKAHQGEQKEQQAEQSSAQQTASRPISEQRLQQDSQQAKQNEQGKQAATQGQDKDFDQAGSKDEQKQAQQDFSKAAKAAQDSLKPDKNSTDQPQAIVANQDKLTPEQRQSVENWLRRVPDDPGGLLRRKFLYQYQQRQQHRNR